MNSEKELSTNLYSSSHNQDKLSAEDYISKHNLDKLFPEMINSLLYEKSQKPNIYIVSFY